MPLVRRIPKRGFTNIFRVSYQVVNLRDLDRVFSDGDTVSIDMLTEKGLTGSASKPVKILASGELTKQLTVRVHAFSKPARAKIEAAGGTCEVVTP
jgi:large subunit ribosomal protein L15